MTLPRRAQVSLAQTPYYHCVSRCVRRAFLCGQDNYTGNDYEHRKIWVRDRLIQQAKVFAIDICAYAIMSNHYHLVLRVNAHDAQQWTDREVMARWTTLFNGPILVQRCLQGDTLSSAQRDTLDDIVAVWRQRLTDISWYMRCLNEHIARQANREDHCTGRFWEGRFKSQALLDDAAVVACMVYVDLNPIRAGMAQTIEQAEFTSVHTRTNAPRDSVRKRQTYPKSVPLLPFADTQPASACTVSLPFRLRDYLALVDATGRCAAPGKRGTISGKGPPLLKRLNLSPPQWHILSLEVQRSHPGAIGNPEKLRSYHRATGRRRTMGAAKLRLVYGK